MSRTGAGDVMRIVVLLGCVVAAVGSATSQAPLPPAVQYAPNGQQQQQQTYTPCEYACGQVSRCNLAPYDACVAQCRQGGSEQQPGGPEHLATISRTSCEQLQVAMQQAGQGQGSQPDPTTATTIPPAGTTPATSGSVETDYEVPPGYTSQQHAAMIVFAPTTLDRKTPCVYGFSPARSTTGSLEADAMVGLLEPLPGWQLHGSSIAAMRGKSATGWSYHWLRADVARLVNGSYEYRTAMAMAFPATQGSVNILWGQGDLGRCMADDASFARLFHSLRPRDWKSDGGAALAHDMLGLWRYTNDVGAMQHRFKPGGDYENALHTTTQIGYTERTSTGVRDGTYKVRDGLVVITPERRDRGVQKLRVRVYEAYKLGKWWRMLATIADGSTDDHEIEYDWIDESE